METLTEAAVTEQKYQRNSNLLQYCYTCKEAHRRLKSAPESSISYKQCKWRVEAQLHNLISTEVVIFTYDDAVICSKWNAFK
ncbi:MAG: hypothetical protein PHQ35_11185 [Phycisphaerae bacterium]|nr:hypothetical protein [Phycisphaerae bacterium]